MLRRRTLSHRHQRGQPAGHAAERKRIVVGIEVRLSLDNNLTISAKQAAFLRYDGTAARWQAIARGAGAAATKSQQQAGADNTAAYNAGAPAGS